MYKIDAKLFFEWGEINILYIVCQDLYISTVSNWSISKMKNTSLLWNQLS